jgi:hypothetical protein
MLDMRQGTCAVCRHNEVIESVPAEFTGDGAHEVPFAVTYDNPKGKGRHPHYPYGLVHMYVCRRCGYVQWYASYPGAVPIGPQYRTRLIKGQEPGEPFR